MLSGKTDPELARYVLARGAFDYIARPFHLMRLHQVLETALAPRGGDYLDGPDRLDRVRLRGQHGSASGRG
jgi:FixJ family two-component response regulator